MGNFNRNGDFLEQNWGEAILLGEAVFIRPLQRFYLALTIHISFYNS